MDFFTGKFTKRNYNNYCLGVDKVKENIYGQIAIAYAKYLKDNSIAPSTSGWKELASQYLEKETMIKKGCPKSTFLGLCEEGLVKGVPIGKYTKSRANKQYAIQAVEILKKNESLKKHPLLLWKQIPNTPQTHNHQMDIVCALWNNGLIKID